MVIKIKDSNVKRMACSGQTPNVLLLKTTAEYPILGSRMPCSARALMLRRCRLVVRFF